MLTDSDKGFILSLFALTALIMMIVMLTLDYSTIDIVKEYACKCVHQVQSE